MDLNIGTFVGQLFGLLLVAMIVALAVLVPVRLGRIVRELEAIKNELRRHNGHTGDGA